MKEYTNYPIITCPDIVLANAEAISLAIREPIVSVVGMGSSGAIITMALLSIRPSWTGVLLKKPGGNECCHRRSVEGNPGWSFNKILVVDDFVSSGRTMEWIVRELGSTKVSYLAAMGGNKVQELFPDLEILITQI